MQHTNQIDCVAVIVCVATYVIVCDAEQRETWRMYVAAVNGVMNGDA
jgi:hypothetical protein